MTVIRFVLLAVVLAWAPRALAQDILSFRVAATVNGPTFIVDGEQFRKPATFLWPRGSKHVISIAAANLATASGNPNCATGSNEAVQYEPDCRTRYNFGGWKNDKGDQIAGAAWTVAITLDGSSSALIAQFTVEYAVRVTQYDGPFGGPSASCQTKAARPFNPPGINESIGIVFFGGQCLDYSGTAWSVPGEYPISALPMAGFVFDGWSFNGAPLLSVSKVTISGPAILNARFIPAKRVRFYTDPPGLRVRIDRAETGTMDPSGANEVAPVPGLLDFVPGSRHVIGAPSPQLSYGQNWVFSGWSNGLAQDAVYTAGTETGTVDVLTARFVRGVSTTFLTEPRGLRLNIDGRENWPNYGFVWGLGTTHTFSAPPEQLDAAGRRWRFKTWQPTSASAGTFTVDQATLDVGNLRFTAVYESLPRLEIQSSLSGIRIDVDGTPCATPCRIDQPEGTEIRVSAPRVLPIDELSRLEFTGWGDLASADRVVVLKSDAVLKANYVRSNKLVVTADPPASADVSYAPVSKDGFYDAATAVTVSLDPRPGFKFRRWEGDLTGTWPQGVLGMSGPRSALARLERYPWLPDASVTPAPGPTPANAVAPGSVIRISGASLATAEQTGPRSPLVQTLGGIVLMLGDRLLSIVSVAPEAIVAVLPSDLPEGEARLTYRNSSGQELNTPVVVSRNAPALFPESLRHSDGTPVWSEKPVIPGEVLTVSGTGFGPLLLPVIDGFPVPESPVNPVVDPVTISVGGQAVLPESCVAEPGASGRVITRFRVPDSLGSAGSDLAVSVAGVLSNTVPLPVTNP